MITEAGVPATVYYKELQDPQREHTPSACADESAVGEHIGLESLRLPSRTSLKVLTGMLPIRLQ